VTLVVAATIIEAHLITHLHVDLAKNLVCCLVFRIGRDCTVVVLLVLNNSVDCVSDKSTNNNHNQSRESKDNTKPDREHRTVTQPKT